MASDLGKNDTLLCTVVKALSGDNGDDMRSLVEIVLNAVMLLERSLALKATPYERSEERTGYANGFKPKTLKSRMGKLTLQIPQTRDASFYPNSLEKGMRSERALQATVAEMYLNGVSTRKVKAITEQLCGLEISSTQVSRMTKELDKELKLLEIADLGHLNIFF